MEPRANPSCDIAIKQVTEEAIAHCTTLSPNLYSSVDYLTDKLLQLLAMEKNHLDNDHFGQVIQQLLLLRSDYVWQLYQAEEIASPLTVKQLNHLQEQHQKLGAALYQRHDYYRNTLKTIVQKRVSLRKYKSNALEAYRY